MAATAYYHDDDYSSDDSSDWSESPRIKRRSSRKSKSTLSKSASAKPIKKAKKPGRKPLETSEDLPSDPKLKRKVQNRAAQRAFRERKEQYVMELREQLKELEMAKEKRETELKKDLDELKRENEQLKQEMEELKIKLSSTDKSYPTSMVSPPTTDDQMAFSPEQLVDTSDLSDYQGSTPMTDSLSSHTFSSPPINIADLDFTMMDYTGSLQPLFGTEMDLFDNNQQELDPLFAEQMQTLTEQDSYKQKMLSLLNSTKETNQKLFELSNDFRTAFPEGNIDEICSALRKKINENKNQIMTDDEVDLYIKCIQCNS